LQNITGTKAATWWQKLVPDFPSFFCVLRWLFLLKTTKLLSIILNKTNQKFSFWLSRVLLWAEVLPKDGMVDVTAAIKPKGRLEVDDGFGVVWNHNKQEQDWILGLESFHLKECKLLVNIIPFHRKQY